VIRKRRLLTMNILRQRVEEQRV